MNIKYSNITLNNTKKPHVDDVKLLQNTDFILCDGLKFIVDKTFRKKGSYNCVYKLHYGEKQYVIKFGYNEHVDDYLIDFSNKYVEDVIKFNKYVPKIYYYGKIINTFESNIINNRDRMFYHVCEYYDELFFDNYNDSIDCICKILEMLIFVHRYNCYIYDLKLANLGIDHNGDVVVIDYDINTFYNYLFNETYSCHNLMAGSYNIICVLKVMNGKGCFRPAYLNKMEMMGFAQIFCDLIFKDIVSSNNKMKDFITALQIGGTYNDVEFIKNNNGEYYNFMTNFVDKKSVMRMIEFLEYRFDDKLTFKDMLLDGRGRGMLSIKYDGMPTYENMLTIIKNEK